VTDGRLVEGKRDLGSAFVLAPHTVVTANHVVRRSEPAGLVFRAANGHETQITEIIRDTDLDIAVLSTTEPLASTFPVAQARTGGAWRITAQPLGNDPRLTGTVTDAARSVVLDRGARANLLQLQVAQELANYEGYSGSALLGAGGVIGVLVEQVRQRNVPRGLATNVLYAVPIQEVLTRFGLRPDASSITGLAGLGVEYAPWIENFLAEYLGRPGQPLVPFGGRDSALSSLGEWLAGDSPYALVTAEAGRGKSALLSHWAAQVHAAGLLDVIFVPISIRFNTAKAGVALPALATRLAACHGESLTSTDRSAEQWQSEISAYLRRPPHKPLLVIIDGLDEATDWRAGAHLFPAAPPPGVRVLVSARIVAGDNWRDRLNWPHATSVALPPLDLDGVSDVLQAMGNPLAHLVTRVDVVSELHRLSEGDPLLVRLYVESLRSQDLLRLSADELPSIETGMRGYYNRWRRELLPITSVQDVQDFLNVLACAFGPMSREDVAALNPACTGLALEGLLEHVARFVIGDGRDQGFVFSHPRFGTFFHELMGAQERARWSAAFVDYGRRAFSDPSPYVLNFHGAHLEVSGAPSEDLYALLDSSWLNAWSAADSTDAGFLTDCDRAWRRAEEEGNLEVIFTCALARGSVAARSNKVPARLLADAYQEGLLTAAQALSIARRMIEDHQRAAAVVALSEVVPAQWLGECVAIAGRQHREGSRAYLIVKLAPMLSGHNLIRARVIAEALTQPVPRATAIAAVTSRLPEQDRTGPALDALSILDAGITDRARGRALMTMAPFLPPEAFSRAVDMALTFTDAVAAIRALCALAWHVPVAHRNQVIDTAYDLLFTPWLDPAAQTRAKFALADHVPELRQEAVAASARLHRNEAAPLLIGAAHWIHDVATTDAWRDQADVVLEFLRRGNELAAVAMIELLACGPDGTEPEWWAAVERARTLNADVGPIMLTMLALRGSGQSKRDLLVDALRSARTVGDFTSRTDAIRKVIRVLDRSDPTAALTFTMAQYQMLRDDNEVIGILAQLNPKLASEAVDDALETAMRWDSPGRRAIAINSMVGFAPQTRRRELRELALAQAGEDPDPHRQAAALLALNGRSDEYTAQIDDAILRLTARENFDIVSYFDGLRTVDAQTLAARRIRGKTWPDLAALVRWMPADMPHDVLSELTNALIAVQAQSLLLELLPRLPVDLFELAATSLISWAPSSRIAMAEAATAAYEEMPEDARRRWLTTAIGPVDSGYGRGWAARIRQLSSLVPRELRGQVVTAACELDVDEQVYVSTILRRQYTAEEMQPLHEAVIAADRQTMSARALIELAKHVPAEQQDSLIHQAFQAASRRWRQYDQFEDLRALYLDAPESWQPELVGMMIDAIADSSVHDRQRLVHLILPILPREDYAEVEELVRTIPHRTRRIDMLRRMAQSDEDIWARVLAEIRHAEDDLGAELLRVLRRVFNPSPDLTEGLYRLIRLADPVEQPLLLVELAKRVPLRWQQPYAADALRSALELERERDRAMPQVAELCAGIPELLPEVLDATVRMRLPTIRLAAITALSRGIKAWQEADRPGWNAAIRVLAEHPRPYLVDELAQLVVTGAPGASAAEAAKAFVIALQRVGEWWD
jgi:hypothetical protein